MGNYDVIVIGSGFGGAVMSCRLAEQGHKVLVLERGRRWTPEQYPRKPTDDWIYDHERPEKLNGWIDLRLYHHMGVAQTAAVGGGSQIYANVSVEAPKWIFDEGWPQEITYDELVPHYKTVGKMLDLQQIPDHQMTTRSKLMQEAAEKMGFPERFDKVDLAVTFDKDYDPSKLDDPFDKKHSKEFTNSFGKKQGTCIHLGNCDIGCDVLAKNTLDLNYLAVAESKGAEVRPMHLVTTIEPHDGGYKVHFDRIENGERIEGQETAAKVVIAAGSLGSTELLLRARDQYKTLPDLSDHLGVGWSSNGDFLTPAFYDREIDPTMGPTITSVINFLDGKETNGERFWVQEGGLPPLLDDYVKAKLDDGMGNRKMQMLLDAIRKHLQDHRPLRNAMPWFGQGIDKANGRFYLRRKWWNPKRREFCLDWKPQDAEGVINGMADMHVKLSKATGGKPVVPPTWTLFKFLVTPHPLGGCNMGNDASSGVVDHGCKVFGYDNLWVVDGAVIPEAIGKNPSRTIAAVAERAAALVDD
ncbi:MAG: GMC family oxidoreductase [Acidobacteriota bacterium]